MIQRFCFVKLEAVEAGARDAIAGELRAALAAAGARAVVGVPADDSAAKWDLSIVIDVPSLDAWRALEHAPPFVDAMDALAARAHVVKAWTFQVA
nr:hypothetical protein [Kofleriaceae bacterium]